ncbi:MAG: 30S ribosome-binding factor RbfA [Deltaproteobacteria bacterium]|nr:30S ribosome-binding factor RbfA [Deltaproteobacteria bacterium]
MDSRRQYRVGEMIRDIISSLILKGFRDPRVQGFITITKVSMTPDLKLARVYVSVMKDEKVKEVDVLAGLKKAAGYIRSQIGKELKLRFTPDLEFKLDTSLDFTDRIDELLNETKKDE